MQVKVLGCSGGVGGGLRTTGFIVDEDILIDAGTGLSDLSIEQLVKVDHIFVTHSHLDHIAFIPLLVDTVFGMRESPILIHATKETWQILKEHIFNWKIWPDFSLIPNAENPFMMWKEIKIGETEEIKGRRITPVPANHVVPAVGFHLEGKQASLVFSGDTTTCDGLWDAANKIKNLRYLIVETAFSNAELDLAKLSKHFCPSLLIEGLQTLIHQPHPQIFITHLKPGEGELIMHEIERDAPEYNAAALTNGHTFDL